MSKNTISDRSLLPETTIDRAQLSRERERERERVTIAKADPMRLYVYIMGREGGGGGFGRKGRLLVLGEDCRGGDDIDTDAKENVPNDRLQIPLNKEACCDCCLLWFPCSFFFFFFYSLILILIILE